MNSLEIESLSIGLPVKTGVEDFEFAVKSIFAQSYKDWRLLIYCDAADENIVCRALAINDGRVAVIVQSEHFGLPKALNCIAEASRTRYLARMDADDVMHSRRLEIQMAHLLDHPEIDVLACGSYLIDEGCQIAGEYKEPPLPKKMKYFLRSGIICHPSVIMKTDWAIANPYDPTWIRTEDKELWLRTSKFTNFAKLDEKLMFIRVPRSLDVLKQRITAKYDRKLIRQKGGEVAGLTYRLKIICMSLLKQFIFQILIKTGFSQWVHNNKCLMMTSQELINVKKELNYIDSIEVPGW